MQVLSEITSSLKKFQLMQYLVWPLNLGNRAAGCPIPRVGHWRSSWVYIWRPSRRNCKFGCVFSGQCLLSPAHVRVLAHSQSKMQADADNDGELSPEEFVKWAGDNIWYCDISHKLYTCCKPQNLLYKNYQYRWCLIGTIAHIFTRAVTLINKLDELSKHEQPIFNVMPIPIAIAPPPAPA